MNREAKLGDWIKDVYRGDRSLFTHDASLLPQIT